MCHRLKTSGSASAGAGEAESFGCAAVSVVSVNVEFRGVGCARLEAGQLGAGLVGYDVLRLLCAVHLNHPATDQTYASQARVA